MEKWKEVYCSKFQYVDTGFQGFPWQDDEEIVKSAKADFLKIKKYLICQTFATQNTDDKEKWFKFKNLSFDDYLEDVGMFSSVDKTLTKLKQYEEALARYKTAIRFSVRGTCAIHPKRDPKDVFTNNFNTSSTPTAIILVKEMAQ